MKKSFKVLILLLILSFISIPFSILADETIPELGDLRCQEGSIHCQEFKNGFGKVTSVEITREANGVKVIKKVSKTEQLGKYSVEFRTEGNVSTNIPSSNDAYVVVIIDISRSLGTNEATAMKSAVQNFSEELSKNKSIRQAFIGFGSGVSDLREFSNIPIGTSDLNKLNYIDSTASHVELAFANASEMLSKVPIDVNKYVILFGDGQYWRNINTCRSEPASKRGCNLTGEYYDRNNIGNIDVCGPRASTSFKVNTDIDTELANLKNYSNIKIYGIRYKSSSYQDTTDRNARIECDQKYMSYITTDGTFQDTVDSTDANAYQKAFDAILASITTNETTATANVQGILTDNIGNDFTMENNDYSSIFEREYHINNINNWTSEPFYINIDHSAENGWHETNENFHLTYETKNIFSSESAEVYWEKEKYVLESCSDETKINSINITNDYVCEYGYLDKFSSPKIGFIANLVTNYLQNGNKEFSIINGLGFPVELDLETNIRCKYIKNKSRDGNLESYLNSYRNSFENLETKLTVNYISSGAKEVDLINANFDSNLECSSNICLLSMKKKMVLPKSCLSMITGEQENCLTDSNKQISGNNRFYIPLIEKGGYISILIAGDIFRDSVRLDGLADKSCQFTHTKDNLIYRQIDLNDPFIKNLKTNRVIGENWLNDKYDFTRIIKSDIWNSAPAFVYSFTRLDVDNIVNNTNDIQDRVDSYLGKDCYFNANNKYVCDFTRNVHNNINGSSSLYTDVKIKET